MTATDHTTADTDNTSATTTGTGATPTAVGRFDKQAMHYNRHAAIQRDMAAWLAQWLPAREATALPADAHTNGFTDDAFTQKPASTVATQVRENATSVLDLGAGEGTFTQYLAQHFTNVSALDSSPQMLREGRRNLPQAQWLHGDAWTLQPLASHALHRVNCITSASLLQWCRTPEETLRHWAQRCPQGMRMLHGFYVEPTLSEWRSLFADSGQLDWSDAQQWQHAFEQSGWRMLRSECEVRRYRFSSALELARSLHGTGAIANAGQLGSGRFRTLLRTYDATFSTRNLPAAEPLYDFDNTALLPAQSATSDIIQPAATALQDTESTPARTHASGVFASWAFFRIETERA